MTLYRSTASGEIHGLVREIPNSVKDTNFKHMDAKTREEAKKIREEESKVVKARYINYRGSHERLTRPYMRWAGDKIQFYNLIPNEEYDLPIGFINEVNQNRFIKRPKEDGPNDAGNREEKRERLHEIIPVGF